MRGAIRNSLLILCGVLSGCGGAATESGRAATDTGANSLPVSGGSQPVVEACALPNAIVGFAFVPDPGAPAASPPNGAITDPQRRSDIIVTSTAEVPSGYQPLRDASATIVGSNLDLRTGANGMFSFARLYAGIYTLRISATGHQPLSFRFAVCDTQILSTGETVFPVNTVIPAFVDTDVLTGVGFLILSDFGSGFVEGGDAGGFDGSTGDGASSSGGGDSSSSPSRRLQKPLLIRRTRSRIRR